MSNCDRVIWALETHSSRINKEQIIDAEARANNLELFEGFRLALDSLITFGVKQVPKHEGPDGPGYSWQQFTDLCKNLKERKITGNAARDVIQAAMQLSTVQQWNDWYRRILIKDLRCGVSEKTVNKVLKKYPHIAPVPVFECMLAHDGANHEKKLRGKKLLEPKLDGVRCITIIDVTDKTVIQYSRNGTQLVNFTHITDGLQKIIDLFERSTVIDGEVVSSSFQHLMKQVHRKDDVQTEDAILMAFDVMPLSEFMSGSSTMKQSVRSRLLRNMKPILDQAVNIDIIEQTEVDLDSYVGELQFKEFNRKCIDEGYEGIMIKDPSAIYECKRSASWLKQKPFIELSLTIVGIEPGTGKNEGKAGAFICEGEEDGKNINANVGSGITDDERDQIDDSVIGQVIEVRADAITMNQDGTYSLRFPRFLRYRGFRAGEKI